jgi:protein required for attachment to host cells
VETGVSVKKTKTTWVVVADHRQARVLSNEGPGLGLYPVEGLTFSAHVPRNHRLVTARLPPTKDGTGPVREAGRFMERISAAIADAAGQRRYDRLVLIAPPHALGELRRALPERVQRLIVGELDSDLTRAPAEAIRERLDPFMEAGEPKPG